MKTFLLTVSLCFAFTLNANSVAHENSNLTTLSFGVCENWVTVYNDCNETFYLCSDNYDSTEDLVEAAQYFTKIKCD